MIRSSQHTLKFSNDGKLDILDKLFQDYAQDLQSYINLIWNKTLPLEKFLSSKLLPEIRCNYSQYKSILYKQASEIIRSQRKKKQGSKNFKQSLKFRDDEIDRICNGLDLQNVSHLYIEGLKNVKHKSKFSKKFNNKLQRWSYLRVIRKLEMLGEEQGINLVKVSSAYTSQTCSKCGFVNAKSRKGELFACTNCKTVLDADYNASLNILHRGVYHPSTKQLTT